MPAWNQRAGRRYLSTTSACADRLWRSADRFRRSVAITSAARAGAARSRAGSLGHGHGHLSARANRRVIRVLQRQLERVLARREVLDHGRAGGNLLVAI